MNKIAGYPEINESKFNFDDLYSKNDPREYYKFLGNLDYIIPHVAQPIFEQVIRARRATQDKPVTVLDLGSSYGVNGALMKYAIRYEALRMRYNAPSLQSLTSEELLELDRAFHRAWPRHDHVRAIGLDISANALRYAESCGALDRGLVLDLETADPGPAEAETLKSVDLIVSTGCVGYVTAKTFARLARLADPGRPAWVVSFVLRMFPYDEIAATLAGIGLETEKLEGATFVQRRFANFEEMEAVVRGVEARGLDTRGLEAEGLYHAELYVSRPRAEIQRLPLQKLVTVVSGADKPWAVGANLMGGFGDSARRRARAGRRRPTLAQVP